MRGWRLFRKRERQASKFRERISESSSTLLSGAFAMLYQRSVERPALQRFLKYGAGF